MGTWRPYVAGRSRGLVKKPMIDVSKMFARNGRTGRGWSEPIRLCADRNVPQSVSSSIVASRSRSRGCADNYADVIQITEMIGERKDMCIAPLLLLIGTDRRFQVHIGIGKRVSTSAPGCMHTIRSLRVRSSAFNLKRIISIDPNMNNDEFSNATRLSRH